MSKPAPRIGPPLAHVVETEIGDEIGLIDPRTERVTVLNTTASDVWRLSDGEHTFEEIVALLASAYGVDAGQIRGDVEEAFRNFIDQGLLTEEQA